MDPCLHFLYSGGVEFANEQIQMRRIHKLNWVFKAKSQWQAENAEADSVL